MGQDNGNSRGLRLWLLAAMTAPLAHNAGMGWLSMLLAGLGMLPLTLLSGNGWKELGKTASLAEFVWLAVTAGVLLQNSGSCWPASNHERFVPLVLLALAACTRLHAAVPAGAVCGLCMLVLTAPLVAAGIGQVELQWLKPAGAGQWSGETLVVFLIPALLGIWNSGKQGRGTILAAAASIGVLFAMLTQGILSPWVAATTPDALRQVGRTIGFGVFGRMEPVLAVAMTIGWYALTALLIGSAAEIGKNLRLPPKSAAFIASAIAGLIVVFRIQISGAFFVIISLILWILLPGCMEKYHVIKNEKSA